MMNPSLSALEISEIITRLEIAKQWVISAPQDAAIVAQAASKQLADIALRLNLPKDLRS